MTVPTAGVGGYEWWKYFIMPFMSGIVGWGTNVLALEMTFKPIEFMGIELFRLPNQPWGLFGWQGIIPTKVEKMASICVDLMTNKLFNISDIFNRLDANKFYQIMEDDLLLMIDEIINDVSMKYMPNAWYYLPKNVQAEIILYAHKTCPEFLESFISDMQANIFNILDIKHMVVTACVKNKRIVTSIFQEVGEQEFIFIRRSGFYFGFLFGMVQMGLWFLYDGDWLLPVCGFIVGWLTNYLALKIIFRPLNPKKFGPITLHGIFLKRQTEVAQKFAEINCVKLLRTDQMWESIFTGPKHKNFESLLRAHSIVFTEKLIGGMETVARAALGADEFNMMKEDIATSIIEKLPGIIPKSYEYTTEAFDLQNLIDKKMAALSYEEFEGVLHPCFEEDEITLIFVGGVLGAIVGVIQMFIF